jgi:hypothetical protein
VSLHIGPTTVETAAAERGAAADPITLEFSAVAEATVTPAPRTGEDSR